MIAFPLASGFALGAAGCTDPGDSGCTVGSVGCGCYPGNFCLAGLTCLSGICVQFGGEGETGDGDGDETGPGDGDGDTGPGDGDGDTGPGDGDGDGDTGPGDGDGEPGDGDGDQGDPCGAGAPEVLFSQLELNEGYGAYSNTLLDLGGVVQIADDFVIPQSDQCWCITEIVATGFWRDNIAPANPPTVHVEIWNGGNMVPTGGAPAYTDSMILDDAEGSLTLPISNEVVSAGTHWLSVHAEVEWAETGWAWYLATVVDGDGLASRDPAEIAYMGNCTIWTPSAACFTDSLPDPWQLAVQFEITGVIGGEACN